MSLHAQLSPEAQAALAAQKRNSTISSLIIALLVIALLGVILAFIGLALSKQNTEEIVSYAPSSDKNDEVVKPEMNNQVEKKPSAPSSSMAKVIAANTPSAVAVPVPDVQVTEPSLDFGDGDDFGDGWGDGDGNGNGGGGSGFGIPASMKQRCSAQDRMARLTKEGGKAEYEEAVVKSLRWLQKNQQKDGSWKAQGKPVAMTGLALLCYLGHCETPLSAEFGETVQNAIVYLVNVANKNGGKMGTDFTDNHWCYEHAIATYAIAEAYTLCKEFNVSIPGLPEAVLEAGSFIVGNQHTSGGWDYAYDTSGARGGDSSIVCWHLQAIKACKYTKLFQEKMLDVSGKKGIAYLKTCELGEKGTIGYVPGRALGGYPSMTPAGALCFQQWGQGRRSLARNGVKWMSKNNEFDFGKKADLYMHYYASQCMINAGGKTWADYNNSSMTHLASKQQGDGSWNLPAGAGHGLSSKHYATCLCTLMMEVYYRFLPSS